MKVLRKDTEQASNSIKVVFQKDLSAILVVGTDGKEKNIKAARQFKEKKYSVQIISGTSQNKAYTSLITANYSSPSKCRLLVNTIQ